MSDNKQPKKNAYEVLGVSKDADHDEIKKAFRRRAEETHPDSNPGMPDQEFKDANEAYRQLGGNKSDEKEAKKIRQQYDAELARANNPQGIVEVPNTNIEEELFGDAFNEIRNGMGFPGFDKKGFNDPEG